MNAKRFLEILDNKVDELINNNNRIKHAMIIDIKTNLKHFLPLFNDSDRYLILNSKQYNDYKTFCRINDFLV